MKEYVKFQPDLEMSLKDGMWQPYTFQEYKDLVFDMFGVTPEQLRELS